MRPLLFVGKLPLGCLSLYLKVCPADDFLPHPFVDDFHPCLKRLQFHGYPYPRRVMRNDTQQLRRHPDRREHVVAGSPGDEELH